VAKFKRPSHTQRSETASSNQVQIGQNTHNTSMTESIDVLVIGAGLAGLAAARDLTTAGKKVLVLEKSRGVGGRAATKRLRLEPNAEHVLVDHGAQFFTTRSERFKKYVAQLIKDEIVREWSLGFPRWSAGVLESRPTQHPRYACPNGMSSLGKALRDGLGSESALEVEYEATVTEIDHSSDGWTVTLENQTKRTATAIVVNMPAPQALKLLREHLTPQDILALEAVRFDPCWAVMAALQERPEPGWRGLELEHPVLSWAALDHSKREPEAPPVVVLHTNPAWSTVHLEHPAENILELVLEAATQTLGTWVQNPRATLVHRWRYAVASITHPAAFLAEENLVICGDWCAPNSDAASPVGRGSPRIETAFESGWASASYLNEQIQ
jgi:renalase